MYDREPLYVISVAARILGMHAQTLRKYEREHFIVPSRTQGRLRLYSAEDIERLRQIKSLVERGLNLAGVELALTLTQQLDELQRTVAASDSREDAIAGCNDAIQEMLALLGAPERQARPQGQSPASAINGGRR